jgi:hypothetical protein
MSNSNATAAKNSSVRLADLKGINNETRVRPGATTHTYAAATVPTQTVCDQGVKKKALLAAAAVAVILIAAAVAVALGVTLNDRGAKRSSSSKVDTTPQLTNPLSPVRTDTCLCLQFMYVCSHPALHTADLSYQGCDTSPSNTHTLTSKPQYHFTSLPTTLCSQW